MPNNLDMGGFGSSGLPLRQSLSGAAVVDTSLRVGATGSAAAPALAVVNYSGSAMGFWSGAGGSSGNLALSTNISSFTDANASTGFSSGSIAMRASGALAWSSTATIFGSADVILFRDAAGALAQRNGTNAQTSRVYGTYTDPSNYVRAVLAATSTGVTIAAETAGTGADNVPVVISPAGTAQVEVGNGVQFTEMTAPSAPAANKVILFAQDNGAGKTQLMALFPSGAAQQVAIEP